MKLKKIDWIFIIALLILTIISIDLLLIEEHQAAITGIWKKEVFQNIATGLLITFIVCVVGNLLPVPTPYSWVVCGGFALLADNPFIPLLFAFIAALGCLVGELGGYIVGRGTAELVSEERTERLSKYQEYLVAHPKIAPFLIFLFGLTPLNDDMLTVPLGLIKYPAKKTIIWIWLGKFGMMIFMAYNAFGLLDWLNPGGLCGLIGGENWIMTIVSLYLIVIMIYLMIRIDFVKKIKVRAEQEKIEKLK
ncbi:MAG: hypothetical protein EU533_07825 [Promethearchaeota archaeon]|nr:MAG: hypothetical protein EU533_07825 [Candidatus Lokiarchaeota archaeon]